MSDYRNIFVTRLNELLHENKEISRLEFSRAIQCDYHAVTNWCDAKFLPSLPSLLKLSKYFNVSIDYLLGISDNDNFSRNKSESFSNRLKSLMNKKKFTNYSLAKKLDIGQPTVSRWFSRNILPETTTLIKLSNLFGVSIEYLLGYCN